MSFRDDWQDADFAREWDRSLPRTNPIRGEHLSTLVEAIAADWREGDRILDLGIGSGQIEESLFRRLPSACVVGIDSSRAMMEIARERLSPFEGRWRLVERDLGAESQPGIEPGGFRYVVCSQVLHEMPDPAKQRALRTAHRALSQDGLFLLADRSRMEDDYFFHAYSAVWKRWKSAQPATLGNCFGDFLAHYQDKDDYAATVGDYLRWMDELGLKATLLHLELNRFLIAAELRR